MLLQLLFTTTHEITKWGGGGLHFEKQMMPVLPWKQKIIILHKLIEPMKCSHVSCSSCHKWHTTVVHVEESHVITLSAVAYNTSLMTMSLPFLSYYYIHFFSLVMAGVGSILHACMASKGYVIFAKHSSLSP